MKHQKKRFELTENKIQNIQGQRKVSAKISFKPSKLKKISRKMLLRKQRELFKGHMNAFHIENFGFMFTFRQSNGDPQTTQNSQSSKEF